MATKRAKTSEKPKTGRPSSYTPEHADSICEHIAGGRSLVSWCKQDETRPSYTSVMRWLESNEAFRDNYARARQDQADYLAEEIVQIADDGANDTYATDDGERTNQDVIARSRLRVDARKWYASKLAPKKYGDRVTHAGDENAPLQVSATIYVPKKTD